MSKFYYTDKEYKQLICSMVVLVDTREQDNKNITDFFDKKGIDWKSKALDTGDYSLMIPKNIDLGFVKDTYFTEEIVIDKKHKVDEIANNIKEERFHNEVQRMAKLKHKYFLIEESSIDDIIEHKYRSQYNDKAFLRTLLRYEYKYDIHFVFCKRENMGRMILEMLKMALDMEILK